MEIHEPSDLDDDDLKIAQYPSSAHKELIDRINKLQLPSRVRQKIAAIASDSAGEEVREALCKNTTLQTLQLRRDNIGDDVAVAIGEALCKNTTLQTLRLLQNNIGDDGAVAIVEGLCKNTTLQTLEMRQNNIGDDGAVAIGEALCKNTTLQTLNLCRNNIGGDGAVAIGEALDKNTTLQTLVLRHNNIGDDGAVAIGEALCKNTALQTLNLWRNNIGDDGAVAIGEALDKNTTLQTLDLSQNNIGDDGAVVIGEALGKNTILQTLYLSQNNIGDDGAVVIGEALGKNTTLQTLYLKMNNIGDDGAVAIGGALGKNATLQTLTLRENKITHTGFLSLAMGFRLNENLTRFGANFEEIRSMQVHRKVEIGCGEFGSVFLAKSEDGKEVVQKTSHDTSTHEQIYERLILQGLPKNPNVVSIAYVWNNDLLLEAHKGGSLKDFAKTQEDGTPLLQFLSYSHGMCLAIEHLHKHGVVHRDIALRNYVLTEDLQTPVLVDFGLSCVIREEKYVMIGGEKMPFKQCAPEVLSTLRYYKASDIWQLGLAMWQLLQRGRQPFFAFVNGQELVQYLNKKMVEDKSHIPLHFRKNGAGRILIDTVKEVAMFCCPYDPDERPTATEVVKKIEFLRDSVDSGEPEEKKEIVKYEPDKDVIDGGLMAYNFTDYERLKTGGQSDYINLDKDRQENENQEWDKFPDADVDAEDEEEYMYQELETLPK